MSSNRVRNEECPISPTPNSTWVVGIDEAGYGPNLGPLVQAAVALRLPDSDPAGWDTLQPLVRSAAGRWGRDARLVIDDSKRVYHGPNALGKLELGVLACASQHHTSFGPLLHHFCSPRANADLHAETWFDPDRALPIESCPVQIARQRGMLAGFSGARFGAIFARVVPAPRFNDAVARTGSKATVLAEGLIELVQQSFDAAAGEEPLRFVCDKQGGRASYGPMLQEAFPEGFVISEVERPDESRYRIEGLGRPVSVVFRPHADGASVAVALASMVCKYLREVCMLQFNAYWAKHVPGLVATAGYPLDAKRFFADIRPALTKLGVKDETIWRCK